MRKILILTLASVLFSKCTINKNNTIHITGEIINRNSDTILLVKQTDNVLADNVAIAIDSTGYFEYDLMYNCIEAYELIFKDELSVGSWRPIIFFPDAKNIDFKIYPMDQWENNIIEGSELSKEDKKYIQLAEDLFYHKLAYWEQKMDSLISINEADSEYAHKVTDSIENITQSYFWYELNYTVQVKNIYGYSKYLSILRTEKYRRLFPIDTLKKYHEFFIQHFPNHPYNEISTYRINGLQNIKVGGRYYNFTASDTLGNAVTVSDLLAKNKYVLIDMWAPWCSPCIYKSKQLVPLYETYKEFGFEVIGVVGGIDSYDKYVKALRKYNYPWLVASDISDKNKLWEKYSISKSGGAQFLIDSKGIICAINPTPKEISDFFKSN